MATTSNAAMREKTPFYVPIFRKQTTSSRRIESSGNVAVVLAVLGVFGTGTAWPDQLVAGVMATLALTASIAVVRHAREELASPACASS
jgi:hypothetical protein